jgi:hypothetical protein
MIVVSDLRQQRLIVGLRIEHVGHRPLAQGQKKRRSGLQVVGPTTRGLPRPWRLALRQPFVNMLGSNLRCVLPSSVRQGLTLRASIATLRA